MELSTEQRRGVDLLVEGERRGILSQDKIELLGEFRKRGMAKPDPFAQADRSPMFFDEASERRKATKLVDPIAPPVVDVQLLEENRARAHAGQTEESLSAVSNLKLGLAANPKKEVKKVLDSQFNADISTRYDKLTGKYQFVHPGTQRITNIKDSAIQALGEAPVVVGDIGGTIAGGLVGAASPVPGGAIIGESVGSASGTFLGEVIRLSAGKAFGMNEDLTTEDMIDLALKKAAITGSITAITGTALHTGKAAINFFKGRTGSKEAAIRAGLNEQEAKEVIDAINDMQRKFGPLPPEREVKFTTAKRSGDEVLLGDETSLRREKDFIRQFSERDAADEQGLSRAFDSITPVGEGGDSAATAFKQVRQQRLDKATNALNQSRQNLDEELKILTPEGQFDTGQSVRQAINDKRIVVNNQVDRVNSQWKKLAGVNEQQTASSIKIPVGKNTRKLLSTLDKESRNAVSNTVKESRKGVVTEKFAKSKGGQKVETGIVDSSGRPITRIEQAQATDLVDYQRTISAFRTLIREADKGASVLNGEQIRVVKRTLRSLLRDRDGFLSKNGNDDVLFAIKNADTFTREARTMLDRSMAGDLMAQRSGRFTVRNQDVFDKGFVKGGGEQSKELVRVMGGNEEAMKSWRSEILEKYRREVVGEDGPNLKKHIKFFNEYKEAMEPFFSRAEMAKIKRLGGFVKVVEAQEKKHANIVRMLNSPQGKVGKLQKNLPSLDPEQVAPWIVGDAKTGPGRSRRVLSMLKSKPQAITEIKNNVQTLFRQDVAPNGILDHARFSSHLKRNAATYKELFGEQYVDDLFTLNKALDISDRAGRVLAERELLGIETQLARGTLFPPLTKEGRLFTAFLKFRTKTGRQAIADALLNPSDLSELAKLSELSVSSREAGELMTSLGFIAATTEDLEQ